MRGGSCGGGCLAGLHIVRALFGKPGRSPANQGPSCQLMTQHQSRAARAARACVSHSPSSPFVCLCLLFRWANQAMLNTQRVLHVSVRSAILQVHTTFLPSTNYLHRAVNAEVISMEKCLIRNAAAAHRYPTYMFRNALFCCDAAKQVGGADVACILRSFSGGTDRACRTGIGEMNAQATRFRH